MTNYELRVEDKSQKEFQVCNGVLALARHAGRSSQFNPGLSQQTTLLKTGLLIFAFVSAHPFNPQIPEIPFCICCSFAVRDSIHAIGFEHVGLRDVYNI